MVRKKAWIFALTLLILLCFSGCYGADIDELYSLPQPQKEYLKLQELINDELAAGCEYSAPTAGSRRQSVQIVDLDGDGTGEALAFLRDRDLTPIICIYRFVSNNYQLAASITGDGSAIGRVEYADLNGDGVSEILTSWKTSTELRLLKAYSILDWESAAVLSASCTDFQICDMDMNGISDVVALNFEPGLGSVSVYTLDPDGEVTVSSAKTSVSLTTAERFRVGSIGVNQPAVFVEGQLEALEGEAFLTDIFARVDGEIKNISLDPATGDSLTKREFPIYCTDIDGDGIMDLPFAEKLLTKSQGSSEYFVFDWYNFDLKGERALRCSTFHNFSDGWYYTLPTEWRQGISIRRDSSSPGERSVIFSATDSNTGKSTDLLTIFTLSDENRRDRAKLENRFVLLGSETVIYAARLNTEGNLAPDKEQCQEVTGRFHLIVSEWITGAL
ncbi:MAG: hypothetical protein RSD48_03910 [Oscillospiraceae bacterium]